MSDPSFWGKVRKSINELSSGEFAQSAKGLMKVHRIENRFCKYHRLSLL